MRLQAVQEGYERTLLPSDVPANDVRKALTYRPDVWGRPFCRWTEAVMRGSSAWSVGERELFGAFVSKRNQCPW